VYRDRQLASVLNETLDEQEVNRGGSAYSAVDNRGVLRPSHLYRVRIHSFHGESPAEDNQKNVIETESFVKVVDNFIVLFDASHLMSDTYPASGVQKIKAAREIIRQQNAVLPDLGWKAGLYTYTPWKPYYDLAAYEKAAFGNAIESLRSQKPLPEQR